MKLNRLRNKVPRAITSFQVTFLRQNKNPQKLHGLTCSVVCYNDRNAFKMSVSFFAFCKIFLPRLAANCFVLIQNTSQNAVGHKVPPANLLPSSLSPRPRQHFGNQTLAGAIPQLLFHTKITFFPPLGQEILPAELPVSKCRYAGPPIFHQTLNIICIHLLTL